MKTLKNIENKNIDISENFKGGKDRGKNGNH